MNENVLINKRGCHYHKGKRISAELIEAGRDKHNDFINAHGREPTADEFQQIIQTSKRALAVDLLNCCRFNLPHVHSPQGHLRRGIFTIKCGVDLIILLYHLCLCNPARTLQSCITEIQNELHISISSSRICNWFLFNNQHRSAFNQMRCLFSQHKCSEENIQNCTDYCNAIFYLNYGLFQFLDEKAFHLGDMLKPGVRADPFTGATPRVMCPQGANSRARLNMFAAMRACITNTFNFSYLITEENGTSEVFYAFATNLLRSGFA